MSATLAEKILARACGQASVRAGEILTARLDLLMMHDSGGPRRVASRLEKLGASVWDPDKIVVVSDHFVPAVDMESADILALTRNWARKAGVTHYDMLGICHVVLQEHGHVQPGMFCVGGDSHSPSGGAFGAFMVGMAPPTSPVPWSPARSGCACRRPPASRLTASWPTVSAPRTSC